MEYIYKAAYTYMYQPKSSSGWEIGSPNDKELKEFMDRYTLITLRQELIVHMSKLRRGSKDDTKNALNQCNIILKELNRLLPSDPEDIKNMDDLCKQIIELKEENARLKKALLAFSQ